MHFNFFFVKFKRLFLQTFVILLRFFLAYAQFHKKVLTFYNL